MQTYWACPMDGTRMAEACFARCGTSRLELGYMVRDEKELVQWQGVELTHRNTIWALLFSGVWVEMPTC